MYDWARLMMDCTIRAVMDPVPVRVDHLLSGRWAETKSGASRERQAAILHDGGKLISDICRNGQYKPIVARYQIGINIPGRQLWPELMAGQCESPEGVLKSRLLVYEGNHRLAIAKTLRWKWVMVEPRVWIWTSEDSSVELSKARYRLDLFARNLGDRQWRTERPSRPDGRPIEPEKMTQPFFGGEQDTVKEDRYDRQLWASLQGIPVVQEQE